MPGDMKYYLEQITSAVSAMKCGCHLKQNQSHLTITKTSCSCHSVFSHPLRNYLRILRLQSWILSLLLLTLVLPVVICDDSTSTSSLCSSDYWCVATVAGADPCSLYTSHTGPVGRLCSCLPYQYNLSLCLNNVSLSVILTLDDEVI